MSALPAYPTGSKIDRSIPLDFWPLTQKDVNRSLAAVREMRIAVVQHLLRQPRYGVTATLVAAIARCLERDTKAALEFIERWDIGFGLSHVAETNNDTLARRLLLAMACSSDESVRAAVDGLCIDIATQGGVALCALPLCGRLRLALGDRFVRVRCRPEQLEIRTSGGSRSRLKLPLHLGTLPPGILFSPYTMATGWGLPVLDSGDFDVSPTLSEAVGPDGNAGGRLSRSMPLATSLARAHDVVSAVWPPAPSWARLLAPAVLRVRNPVRSPVRLSGSFGPGRPIYLSTTTDPSLHAEDMLHELQHLRFHIWCAVSGWPPTSRRQAAFVSPFRPDLRPLFGLHLGLHAFITVNELRLRAADLVPLTRSLIADTAIVHLRNLFAFRTVARHEVRSRRGDRYLEALAQRLIAQHEAISHLAPKSVRRRAQGVLGQHIRRAGSAGPALNTDLPSVWCDSVDIDPSPGRRRL